MSKRRQSATGAARSRPKDDAASGLYKAALDRHRVGQLDEAELLYRSVIAQNPNHAHALSNLGVVARKRKRLNEAISLYRRALQADPNLASAHHNLGNALVARGLREAAQKAFRSALRLKPDYVDARVGLAGTLASAGDVDDAIVELKRALEHHPENLDALDMVGNLLVQRREYATAIPYLKRTIAVCPQHAGALNNLGCLYSDHGQKAEARRCFEQAIVAAPTLAQCHLNLGNMVRDLEGSSAAVPHFKRATELDPKYAKAWFNLGSALSRIDMNEAVYNYHRTLELQPQHIGALTACLAHAEKSCAFAEAELLHDRLQAALPAQLAGYEDWTILGNVVYGSIFRAMPHALMAQVEHRIDRVLIDCSRRQGSLNPLPLDTSRQPDAKIRVGYISPNFRDHPVGHVTLSLFRSHDRSRFEVHGFSTSTAISEGDTYTVAHRQGFDVFHHIGRLSARDAAMAIRNADIDILVDLDGYMDNMSPPILAFRPARLQVYWLGHAGGLGLSFIDYLIADNTVLPPSDEHRYTENIVRLPDVYHCADRPPIAAEVPNRAAFGLPESGFIFCVFNNPQKIDANVLDCWLRILERVDGSCLWLSNPKADNAMVTNLRDYAKRRGVAPSRLVFSSRIADKAVHLGRQRHAGLFLDTLTLNASTTALDALWAGVPVLTVFGEQFASRIASTMLRGLGLDALVAKDLAEYERRAVEFAQCPSALQEITMRLGDARNEQPLFDTKRFVHSLERGFEHMWASYLRGDPPHAFDLAPESTGGTPSTNRAD